MTTNPNTNRPRPGRNIPSVRILPFAVTVNVGLSRTEVKLVNAGSAERAEKKVLAANPRARIVTGKTVCTAVTIPSMFL